MSRCVTGQTGNASAREPIRNWPDRGCTSSRAGDVPARPGMHLLAIRYATGQTGDASARDPVGDWAPELGRGEEYRLFFLDLQVNESRAPWELVEDDTTSEPGDIAPEISVTPGGPRAMA